jgi:hypothetical protein
MGFAARLSHSQNKRDGLKFGVRAGPHRLPAYGIFRVRLRRIRPKMDERPSTNRLCELCGRFIPLDRIAHGRITRSPARYCSPKCRGRAKWQQYVHTLAMRMLRGGGRAFASSARRTF